MQLCLEDVYKVTSYRLAPDSQTVLHEGGGRLIVLRGVQ